VTMYFDGRSGMFGLVAYDFFLFYPDESSREMDILDIIIGRPFHAMHIGISVPINGGADRNGKVLCSPLLCMKSSNGLSIRHRELLQLKNIQYRKFFSSD
jgi:hypothetical protein